MDVFPEMAMYIKRMLIRQLFPNNNMHLCSEITGPARLIQLTYQKQKLNQ
jgi:hypothetical protein